MTEIIDLHEAKTTLSRLVERALEGEEIIIARNGMLLVPLVPVPQQPEKRIPGRSKGKIRISPDLKLTGAEIGTFKRE
jgi:antitoxin (DNA-binding transcriptional repressor) of toxin-antitoxin stability system